MHLTLQKYKKVWKNFKILKKKENENHEKHAWLTEEGGALKISTKDVSWLRLCVAGITREIMQVLCLFGGRFQEVTYESAHALIKINFYFFWHTFIQNYSSLSKLKNPLK